MDSLTIDELCEVAIQDGNLALVKYACTNGCKITKQLCDDALAYGNETGDFSIYQYVMNYYILDNEIENILGNVKL